MTYDELINSVLRENILEKERPFRVVELDVELGMGELIPTLTDITEVSGTELVKVLKQVREKWPTSEDAYTKRAMISEANDFAVFWVNKKKVIAVIGDKSKYWHSDLRREAKKIVHDSSLIFQKEL